MAYKVFAHRREQLKLPHRFLNVTLADIAQSGFDGFDDVVRTLSLAHPDERDRSRIASGAPEFARDLAPQRREPPGYPERRRRI
jgi:hypothetical protein